MEDAVEPASEKASKRTRNRKSKRNDVSHEDRGRLLGEDESAQLLINLSRASLNFSDKASARQNQADGDAHITTEALQQDGIEEIDASETPRTKRKHQDGDRSKRKRNKYKSDTSKHSATISAPLESQGNGQALEPTTRNLDEAHSHREVYQEYEDGSARFMQEPSYHEDDNIANRQSSIAAAAAAYESPAQETQKAKQSKRRKRKTAQGQRSTVLPEQG